MVACLAFVNSRD